MPSFEIDPDIGKARTLNSEFYTDEQWFELSREKIFARSWQLIAGPELSTGLTPITLLPGFLGEPLIVSKSENGVKCFSNVCTHRGKILLDEPCSPSLIRCNYHGRRFSLDGKFLSMPGFEGVADFPGDADDLKQVATAECGGFVFASLDAAHSFETLTAGTSNIFGSADRRLVSARDYKVAAHWALYCENYLEGFHIPFVHHSLNEIVDYGTYKTETFRYSSVQTGLDDKGDIAGRYLFIFPNMMFNFYPWGISVNLVKPVSASSSVVTFLTYVSDDTKLGEGAGADLHRVELEDEAVVESVQKGIRSRFYSQGRYSPTHEQGTHHFHRLIAEFMS